MGSMSGKKFITRKKRCKHFNGTMNECCEIGIDYRVLVGGPDEGWIKRTPCFWDHQTEIQCLARVFPTLAEEAEDEERIQKRVTAMCIAIIEIQDRHKKDRNHLQGIMECPACGGVLAYTIAQCNGHIWGQCKTTKGCLAWMQ
ncbi:MAG: hypothetical protein AAGU11_00885 [Syntrophobacteraceae bacterium]